MGALSHQLNAVSYQLHTVSYQMNTVSYQLHTFFKSPPEAGARVRRRWRHASGPSSPSPEHESAAYLRDEGGGEGGIERRKRERERAREMER